MRLSLLSLVHWSLILATIDACKPAARLSEVSSEEPVNSSGAGDRPFDYEISGELVRSFASRVSERFPSEARRSPIGCARAADWFVVGKNSLKREFQSNLRPALDRMTASRNFTYDSILKNLTNPAFTYAHCKGEFGLPRQVDSNEGLSRITERNEFYQAGTTLLVVDFADDFLNPDGALASVRRDWQSAGKPNLRVEYVSLSNFANLPKATAELLDRLKVLGLEVDGKPHVFHVFASGSAGNVVLHALGQRDDFVQKLRNQTDSVVTLATPIGGSMTGQLGDGVIDKALKFATQALSSMGAKAPTSDQIAIALKVVPWLTRANRAKYLEAEFRELDFTVKRAGRLERLGDKLRILHVASVFDATDLAPLPLLTVKDGRLATLSTTRTLMDAILVAHTPLSAKFPLSDGIVSLADAVIPKNLIPKGLDPRLIGVLNRDHFTVSGMTSEFPGSHQVVPAIEFADAVLQTMYSLSYGSLTEEENER